MTKSIAPAELVKEAAEVHQLFMSSWLGFRSNALAFGKALVLMQEKQLHQYVPKPGKKKGFMTFEEYVTHFTKGDCSTQTIYDCKNLYKLTVGDHAIPEEVVREMPKKNALKLASLPSKKRTREVVQRARVESVNEFAVTHASVLNEDKPISEQRAPKVHRHLALDPRADTMLTETMEDFKLLKGVVRDGDLDMDLDSKAIIAICISARNWCQDVIKAAKAQAQNEAPEISQAEEVAATQSEADSAIPDTFVAPDAAEKIGIATGEGRVVKRISEAHN